MQNQESWLIPAALLVTIATGIIGFVVGVGVTGFVMERLSPPAHGEAHMAIAYGSFFLGGPVGAVIGALLGGVLTKRWWPAWSMAGRVSLILVAVGVLVGTWLYLA